MKLGCWRLCAGLRKPVRHDHCHALVGRQSSSPNAQLFVCASTT
jgi:hypothetical protein